MATHATKALPPNSRSYGNDAQKFCKARNFQVGDRLICETDTWETHFTLECASDDGDAFRDVKLRERNTGKLSYSCMTRGKWSKVRGRKFGAVVKKVVHNAGNSMTAREFCKLRGFQIGHKIKSVGNFTPYEYQLMGFLPTGEAILMGFGETDSTVSKMRFGTWSK